MIRYIHIWSEKFKCVIMKKITRETGTMSDECEGVSGQRVTRWSDKLGW